MKELTVYQKMTASTAELIKTVNAEIGFKCCQPSEAKRAANVFLDNLQTLFQGGVTSEDYDKLDLVKRGNVITVSARVQALIRAFRRKGYMLIDTIIPVPKDDDVYFEENYKDGIGIIYLVRDQRKNPDRRISAERLVNNYFEKFICRLEIREVSTGRTIMTVSEMSNEEVMYAQSSSDNGIFFSEWKEVVDKKGNVVYKDAAKTQPKKYKVIYDGSNGNEVKYNTDAMWVKWTSEMVKKTVMRRALKNIKETIPELAPTIMAFDTEFIPNEQPDNQKEAVIEVDGITNVDIDLNNLTEEQKDDVKDCYEIYCQNPENAKLDAEKCKKMYEEGVPLNQIINENYAELINLSKSKKLYPLVENIIKGIPYEKNEN